jgi:hypothetical protein
VSLSNRETQATLAFHNASKYRVIRDDTGEEKFVLGSPPDPDSAAYEEDPELRPLPYKIYVRRGLRITAAKVVDDCKRRLVRKVAYNEIYGESRAGHRRRIGDR